VTYQTYTYDPNIFEVTIRKDIFLHNKGRSPSNGKLFDFSFYIDSQKSAHRKFKHFFNSCFEELGDILFISFVIASGEAIIFYFE
jgi:hypothetical protein